MGGVATDSGLYPPIEPYDKGMLGVGNGHTLYYEQCGRPDGATVVFLHGGPGGGCQAWNRRLFDPSHYRVLLFDQRGCGRSTPHGRLAHNTTWDLVEDIERLRKHLGLGKMLLFGGSWGSTLAVAYAQTHPQWVSGLILRGVFLARRRELDWFYRSGTSSVFPEAWAHFSERIPPDERGDLPAAYYRRLIGEDEDARIEHALAWTRWEFATSRLRADPADQERIDGRFAVAFARIESHFFVHNAWLDPDDMLLRNAHRLGGIPGIIVQGRYDAICPPTTAWELAQRWPDADLQIVTEAGHSALEPQILQRLVAATDAFRAL